MVADFDRTISNHSCNVSCHGVLEGCTELGAEYRAETLKLKEVYAPPRFALVVVWWQRLALST